MFSCDWILKIGNYGAYNVNSIRANVSMIDVNITSNLARPILRQKAEQLEGLLEGQGVDSLG